MFNSAADSRSLARRIALCQVVFTFAVAAAFGLMVDGSAALGAVAGGMAVTLGSALMAWRSLSGGVRAAGGALLRVLGALAIKWCVVVLVLYLALVQWGLQPLAVLSGVMAAVAANVVAVGFRQTASLQSDVNQSASNQGSRRGG